MNADHAYANPITLSATDNLGTLLTFAIVASPTQGSVSSITQPDSSGSTQQATLTYTPNSGASGSDSFTYYVTNGTGSSSNAIISITINPYPTTTSGSSTGNESTTLPLTLQGSDSLGRLLTFSVVAAPSSGTLGSITQPSIGAVSQAATVTYTPNSGFSGTDSFTFKANNGHTDSTAATISLTINTVPVSDGATIAMAQAIANPINLTSTEDKGRALTFSIVTAATHGTLSPITQPSGGGVTQIATLTYTPNDNFSGSDSFTYSTFDGIIYSAAATINITVVPSGNAPLTIALITKYSSLV